MKKLLLFALLVCFLLSGCSAGPAGGADAPEGVSGTRIKALGLSLSAKDITPTGLTLLYTQRGSTPTGTLQTGTDYKLEQAADGAWQAVAPKIENYAWNSMAYLIEKDGETEQEINWEYLYGTLSPGMYRLTKEVMDLRGAGDFDTAELSVFFTIL